MTPAKGSRDATLPKGLGGGKGGVGAGIWDSDSDEDGLEAGMSPPKTMQFHVPQGRLLKTPGGFIVFAVTFLKSRLIVFCLCSERSVKADS